MHGVYPAAEFTLGKECVLPEKTEQQGPLSTHLRGAPAEAAYLLSADMICRAAKDNTQSTLALWQRSKMCPPQNKKGNPGRPAWSQQLLYFLQIRKARLPVKELATPLILKAIKII